MVLVERMLREQRKLARLLTALVTGGITTPLRQHEHRWAIIGHRKGKVTHKWAQLSYFTDIGYLWQDLHTQPTGKPLAAMLTSYVVVMWSGLSVNCCDRCGAWRAFYYDWRGGHARFPFASR